MKLLIISFSFPPQVGGVAEVARTQAAGFSARGHEVTVATEFDPAREGTAAIGGASVRQFRLDTSLNNNLGEFEDQRTYADFLRSEPWDLVLFNCWRNPQTDLALPALKTSRAKKVMLSHGFDAHIWHPQPRPLWGLAAWLRAQPYLWSLPRRMRAFDQLVFLSQRGDRGRFLDHFIAKCLFPSRISVIPNGVHLLEFRGKQGHFRQTYGITTQHLLLNVANYCYRKNQLATLRDFMRTNQPQTTLVFIGAEFNQYATNLAQEYERLRARFPQPRVLFLEKTSKEMIYAAYQAAEAFILSARSETQPLAILDAMAAGIPFISTNAGCVTEFPGGIVAPSGPETTRAICRLLSDRALRERLGHQGRAACETKYDWERVLDRFETLFTRLLNGTSPVNK